MNESTLIKSINVLLLFASACLFHGLLYYVTEEHRQEVKGSQGKKTEIQIPEPDTKEPNPNLEGYYDILSAIESIDVYYTVIETEYVGVCYITAYCPQELGYVEYSDGTDNFPKGWATASGAICHYSESNFEPTTCAIDRRYFGFNEYLMVDGKVYVTEDTGAFSGMWIDVFRPTYEQMWEHGSHYSEVYSVEFVTKKVSAKERMKNNEWFRNYLRNRGVCIGFGCRNGC